MGTVNGALRRIPFAEQREVPWSNGGGSTREIAIDPPGASLASGFRWRVSRAQVAADGPFSVLAGVDRSLWLLSGDGMLLAGTRQTVALDVPLARVDFAGEEPIHATLLGGPCEDLNVMSARAFVLAQAELRELAAGERLELPAAPQHVVLALGGALRIEPYAVDLGAGDAVRADGAGTLRVVAAGACTVLSARFTPRG